MPICSSSIMPKISSLRSTALAPPKSATCWATEYNSSPDIDGNAAIRCSAKLLLALFEVHVDPI